MPSDTLKSDAFFKCQNCGKCCKGFGGTYLADNDIEFISQFINSTPKRFVDHYCSVSGNRPLLAQRQDGYCIFWDQICTIHPVKPLMCRKWPFLESILIDTTNWLIMADSCPGIQTDVDPAAVEKIVRQMILRDWNIQ
jgi:Fe-S-cluster containining protein